MASEKVFVVVEAVDRPPGAMLVRYAIVERVEPDPEEERLASAPPPQAERPAGVDEDTWELVQSQIAAANEIYKAQRPPRRTIYRTEEKVAICTKIEEIAAAITEAKEQYEEIRKLKKAGAHFEIGIPSLRSF